MDGLDLLLVSSGGAYLAAILWLGFGLRRSCPAVSTWRPRVSVVIAARNEALRLGKCLQALKAQDYEGELEVVVVDDRSQDDTSALVQKEARHWPALRGIRAQDQMPFRCPKKSALAQGIQASSGELLLFTDADCRPPPGWVRSMVSRFAPEVGLVAGYACPEPGRRLRQKLLALDNLAIGALSAGSMAMGWPLACTGRNLAYRRSVYDEVGGFTQIGHWVGGDDVYFMRLVATQTSWRLVYNRDPEAVVRCEPPPEKVAEIFQQKVRHAAKAGNYQGLALGLGGIVYLFHLALFLGLARMVWQGNWEPLLLGVWGSRWLVDGGLLWRMALAPERRLLVTLPLLEVCYIPYVLLFTAMGKMGWFRWKP